MNSVIVWWTAPLLPEDQVLTATHVLHVYAVVLALAIVSLAATVLSMHPDNRHTLFGSKSGKAFWREYWLDEVLHASYQTVDEQREEILCTVNPTYVPVGLALPWILEKAAEIDRKRAEAGEAFVAPRWLTRASCDRQRTVITFWRRTGRVSEDEAREAHACVDRLRGLRRFNPAGSMRFFPTSGGANAGARGAAPSAKVNAESEEAKQPRADTATAAEGKRAKAWTDTVSEDPEEPTPTAKAARTLPALGGAKIAPVTALAPNVDKATIQLRAPPSTRSVPRSRKPSLSEGLGVRAELLNRRRSTNAAGVALVAPLAKELAEVMREASDTEAAVAEWWDVNVGGLEQRRAVARGLFAALAEELWPALLLARVFVWL